jgi:hypothetical protein
MEVAPENGKESSHSAHGSGINERTIHYHTCNEIVVCNLSKFF